MKKKYTYTINPIFLAQILGHSWRPGATLNLKPGLSRTSVEVVGEIYSDFLGYPR